MKHSIESEDYLRASNALLKLKLELEYEMELHDTSELTPRVENQWLQNIYKIEKQYKESTKISVYDFVGRPAFTPAESLTPEELPRAITEMTRHLCANGICLDFGCPYENSLIYRFITTEFFAHEIDGIILEGGSWFFTYEEFHPNHDFDLRRTSDRFINYSLRKGSNDFEMFALAKAVTVHNTLYSRSGISCLIAFFQDLHTSIELEFFKIQNVHINLENKKAIVRGDLSYLATLRQKEAKRIEGPVILHFEIHSCDWEIVQIEFPGL